MCKWFKTVLIGFAISAAVLIGISMWHGAKAQEAAPEVCSSISVITAQGEATGAKVVKVEQKDLGSLAVQVGKFLNNPDFKFDPRVDSITFFFNVPELKEAEAALVLYADKNGCIIGNAVGNVNTILHMLKELKGSKV